MSDSQTNNNSKFSFDPSTAKPVETPLVAKSEGFNFDPSSAKEEKKGFKGHAQDTGASLMSGLAAVPDTLVGLADMYTEGRAGKSIDDNLGDYYKLGNAQNYWQDKKTDISKEQQQQFHEADGIVDKTKVALQNPSMIANAAVESLPSMFLGGALGRATKIANPVAGAAIGEGAVMAGAQAEQIRQNSDDQMLNNGQEAAAALTGGLGALFGFAGGKLAQKLGIGDIDTMIVQGRVGPAQVAAEIANTPAKSLPRRVIEGAISEGFLEELPQSVSEQIIQNLATDKPWSDGVEDAAVMGTLAGMAMGGVANIPSGHRGANNNDNSQTDDNPSSPLPQLGGPSTDATGEFIPREDNTETGSAQQDRTNFEYTQFDTDASNRLENNGSNTGTGSAPVNPEPDSNGGGSYFENQSPSERLGLNPDHGPMSSAAALAVDNGVSPITPDVTTNTSLPGEYKQLLPQQNQNIYQSEANQSQNGKVDNQLAPKTDQNTISSKPIFSSNETAGTMSYANDITNQALEHYKNDNAELTDRKSSLTGKGAATDLIYYKNSPSFSNVDVVDAGDKSIVKLTNAKTGQITEREYPRALVGFNDFMESNNANDLTQNDSAKVDEVSKLEQQLLDTKSIVKKAQIRKQIEALKSQEVHQVENEQSQKSKAIELSANEAATSPLNNIPEPTQAQIEAGNYKKGHVNVHGLDISIENPKGSSRSGMRPDGTQWEHTMVDHYGYIKRTTGADNEHIDTYVGNNPDSDRVFIVDQLDQETGGFDEHKVMLGFDSQDAATTAYKSNFDDGWKVGPVRSMNVTQFKDWLKNGDTTKPSVANKLPSKSEQKKLDSTLNDAKTVNRAQVGYDLAKKSGNRIIYNDNQGRIDTADIVLRNINAKGREFFLAIGTDNSSLGKYKVISEHGLTIGGIHKSEADAIKTFNERIANVSDQQLKEAFERAGKIVQDSGKSQDDLKQQFEDKLYKKSTSENKSSTDNVFEKQLNEKFSNNKIFKADAVEKARARLKKKFGQLNSGIDPEVLIDGMTIAGAYIESGVRKFGDYAKAMVADFGEDIKPYLLSFWEGARNYPELDTKGMTSVEESKQEFDALNQTANLSNNMKKVVGEKVTKPKATKKTKTDDGSRQLVQDWGVRYIDGWATNSEHTGQIYTDYGYNDGVKAAFLKDTKQYLESVQKQLEQQGYHLHLDKKGKPEKISTNEAGSGVSGDVSLKMTHDDGINVYVTIGESSMASPHPQRVAIMYRATVDLRNKSASGFGRETSSNQWASTDFTAAELATSMDNVAKRLLRSNLPLVQDNHIENLEAENNANSLQTKNVSSNDTQPASTVAPTGNRNSESLDDGVAKKSGSPDPDRGVSGRIEKSGRTGTDSVQQRSEPSSGTSRDSGTVRTGSSSTVSERELELDPATSETSEKPVLDKDFNLQDEEIGKGGIRQKYKDNIATIKILKTLESENRVATPEERKQIAQYTGWGALKGVFDKDNKQWSKEYTELKSLLTDAEYAAARASVLNAHYTSKDVVNGIISIVERIGFKSGRVLEPSVGTGNFFGLMPAGVRKKSELHGVELDPITSQIVDALYPSAKIAKATGFQDFQVPAEYFDLVIGNPPFGNEPIVDNDRSAYSGSSIHNYFFAKSIDKLRPGGVLAMVVSHNFMDARSNNTRKWIAERADLVAAVRLPNTAFKENAGTEVVTDIIVLRKRGKDEKSSGIEWVETGLETLANTKTGEETQHHVNNYFINNPKHILGEATATGSMYKANEYTVESLNYPLAKLLSNWVTEYIPENIYQPISRTDVMSSANYSVPDGVKVGSFFIDDKGEVLQRGEDELGSKTAQSWLSPNNKALERIKGMIALRDALRDQMRMEKSLDADSQQIEANRKKLNELYDQFHKNFGYLNNQTNRRIFLDDTESALVQALEFDYDRGVSKSVAEREEIEPRPESATKADIFKMRVLFPPTNNIKVYNANDALLASLNYKGKIDLDYMAELYDKPVTEIVSELGEAVYNDPIRGMVMADEYLSGDVKTKLEEAQAMVKNDPAFKRNVEALKKVIPKDKLPSEIHATLGASFIPTKIYDEFAQEITGMKFSFRYLKATGQWIAMTDGKADPALNMGKWGIEKMPASDILTKTMAGQGVVVTQTIRTPDGNIRTAILEKETEAAREKQAALKVEWQRWLWADPDRAEQVATIYNEKMNRIVNRKFDGSHLTFPGMNPVMALLPHQKNAVWRALQDRQVLLDHVVGAGKTFEIVTAFMEMRRLGIARKPFIAVPNHLTLQWRSEFNRLYPGSNILAATPDDFSKGNREKFFSKIITGDWDAVIVGHSSLKKIALPAETEKAVLEEQINEITTAIEEVKRDRGDRNIIRDMENIRTRLQNRMKQRIQNLGDRDKVVTFDELGADAFAVDELHEFKNLFYNTTMQRVPGMGNPKGSDKAFDLFVKLQWMFNTFGNDNAAAIGATGTPVSNSLVEMFNMQRLLQYPTLKANDLHVFDAWAKQFGSVESVYEVSPSGTGFRQSNRFSKFKNLPALMALYNSFADTVTLDDLKAQEIARGKTFPVPKIVGGRPQNVVAKRSEHVAQFMGTPELDLIKGQPKFGFNPSLGDSFRLEQNDGKFDLVIKEESGLLSSVSKFDTEEDAKLALVEAALTPKITIDPKSILGQFNNLKNLTQQTKGKINALSLTGQANKAGLDYRLINPSAPDFKDSKINKAVAHTLENYKKWNKDKGTQLIFCDMSIPLSARSGLANKERRVYVRNDGNLTHKKGTMHTVEGHEELPFFVVKEGSGKDKTSFTVYDAVSGMRVKGGMPSKAMAIEQASQLVKNDESRQTWINAIEQTGEIEQDLIDEYNSEHEIDAEAVESITREDIAGSSGATQFSVYDDIKAKLIKQGIPEREIAFIHDYNTPSAKEKLFKAVNSGAVRVLLGSTQKMGAGTNVQQRLVALHHIDAPWKPSDLEQREGRIVRRGNRLYERDPENFEVAIYRYATEQTYDTRRWQILEHKARGIEQLRNYDGSLNEIDDIEGEAANAADMKAAASGDPLILEETQLRNEVRRLETLQSAHVDEKQMLRGRIRQNQRFVNETSPRLISEYHSLIETANKHPIPEKDKFVGVKIDGRTIIDREKAVKSIQSQLKNAFAGQREVIFNFRGITFSLENIAGQVHLNSPTERMVTFDTTQDNLPSASGMLTRFANYIGRLNDHVVDIEHEVELAKKQIESMSQQLEQTFAQAQDLVDAREAHKRVQRRLIAKGPDIPANQKPILEKALNSQRSEIEKLGLGDALKEFEGNNDLKDWSRDELKPDNQRRGASSIDTIFGTLSRNSAVRHVASILDHLKLTTTQDTSTGILRISDKSGLGSFSVQVISGFDGLPREIQEAATYQDEDGNTQNYVVSGVWHGDTLYLVADGIEGNSDKQITTFEAYQETIIHEVIGHFGVQQIFGNEYKTKFQQLYNALGGLKGIRKIASENGVDMHQLEVAYIKPYTQGAADGIYDSTDVQQALVSELFAFVAQNKDKRPFVLQKLKEVLGYIRQWLRERGFMKLAQYKDADILMFIAEARKAVVDRRYFGKFKDQTISTNNTDKLFSRGQSSRRTSTTVDQVRNTLNKRFGKDVISELERQGKLEILSTFDDAGIEGFYHNGKATLIANALTADTIVPTFLHELGGHGGFQNLMNQDQYKALMKQFNDLVERGNPIAVEAKRLAERENDSATQQLEMLPYLLTLSARMQVANAVQKGSVSNVIGKLVSAVKAWAFDRLGVNLNLNPNDMVTLAERMIQANLKQKNSFDRMLSQYRNSSEWLRAPNGKKSNLSQEQWVQVRTPEFKQWFGDWQRDPKNASKMLDENGEPQILYHGTNADFQAFNVTKAGLLGPGIYITPNFDTAETYANNKSLAGGQNIVMPLFANIRNPLRPESNSREVIIRQTKGHDGVIKDIDSTEQYVLALDPRQLKSAFGNNGQFSTADDNILFSRQYDYDQIINRLSAGIKNVTVKNVKDLASYKFTDLLGIGLSVLGRRQLTEIYNKLLPQLNRYNDLAAQMDAEKNDAGAEADQIVRDWGKLADHNELAELMHDATLAKIDPAKPHVSGDSISKYKQLRNAYDSLSPEAQTMYKQARDTYKKHYAKVQQAIKERILRSELSSQKKADLLKQMDSQFYGYTKGVYFPLARFGKYVVITRDRNGAVESVSRAETMAEAQALRSELMQKYPHLKVDRVILDKEFNASRDAVGRGFMTSLFAEVDNLGLSTAEQAEFEDTLSQLYLSSLPDLSWAKHGIHRKGTAGFSQDARRAFAQNMFHGAGYLAKLRYSDQLAEQLDKMQKYSAEQAKINNSFDQPTAQRVIDEMNKRHDNLMNPKSHPLSSALTSLGFIYYLGLSPASAMVNMLQTPLVAYPVLGAKWGYDKAGKALIKASEQAIKGKNDISKALSADERKAYDQAVNSGVIDVTQAHDLAGIAQGEDSGIMWKTRPVMRWASFLFHQAERFNREVTFIAAYRLARESGSNFDDAYKLATDATYQGHFDYSSGNRPRLMQGNVAKVMLLFKQFGQNMVYLLARQAHQAIKAEKPQDRAQARRLLAGVLTTHALAAGVLGLPMVTTLLAAASMIGGDDDEPWDAEVALRNFFADIFGSDISNMIMKGASRGTPFDISGRVGLNNLILPDIQEGLEGRRLSESAMAAALGPVASIATNVLKGTQEISEGQFARGIESMLPTFLKSPLKALRFAEEGVQDKTGVTIQDEVSTLGLIGQAMGFSPSETRTAMEGKSAIYQLNRRLEARRGQLMAQWARAKLVDDTDRMDDIWSEIEQFNEKNPSRRITRVNLQQSYRNRKKRIDKAEDGVYLSRSRQDAREAGRFAFGE